MLVLNKGIEQNRIFGENMKKKKVKLCLSNPNCQI